MKKGKSLSKIFPDAEEGSLNNTHENHLHNNWRNPHYWWASKLWISIFMFCHHHQQFITKFWRRPKQSFVKSAAWFRLNRENNKKKKELRKVQESYRPQYPHPITLEQLLLITTNPDTPETLQDRQIFSKSFANWTCSPSEPTNFKLI